MEECSRKEEKVKNDDKKNGFDNESFDLKKTIVQIIIIKTIISRIDNMIMNPTAKFGLTRSCYHNHAWNPTQEA